jgi:hypothetical protein
MLGMQPDPELLQVEHDLGDILHDAGDGGELMQHPLDLDRHHC